MTGANMTLCQSFRKSDRWPWLLLWTPGTKPFQTRSKGMALVPARSRKQASKSALKEYAVSLWGKKSHVASQVPWLPCPLLNLLAQASRVWMLPEIRTEEAGAGSRSRNSSSRARRPQESWSRQVGWPTSWQVCGLIWAQHLAIN